MYYQIATFSSEGYDFDKAREGATEKMNEWLKDTWAKPILPPAITPVDLAGRHLVTIAIVYEVSEADDQPS